MGAETAALETLTELTQSFIVELGRSARSFCELACRVEPVSADVLLALVEMGIPVSGIQTYAHRSQRVTIPSPSLLTTPKQTSILHTGNNKKHPSSIPDNLPEFPDSHSYIRTPTHRQPVTDYEMVREKAAIVPPVAPMIVGVPMRPAMVVPATPVFAPAPTAPPVYIQHGQVLDEDEPASKRSRTEENLIPEGEFLARNVSPVTMSIAVPNMPDKPEWKCDGQMLSITLSLTETVNSIKSKIMEELGMPQGKQKLQHETIFLKDANSLAYYNILPGAVINLQLKERGGRKK